MHLVGLAHVCVSRYTVQRMQSSRKTLCVPRLQQVVSRTTVVTSDKNWLNFQG